MRRSDHFFGAAHLRLWRCILCTNERMHVLLHQDNGGKRIETTYSYFTAWSANLIDYTRFDDPHGHENPTNARFGYAGNTCSVCATYGPACSRRHFLIRLRWLFLRFPIVRLLPASAYIRNPRERVVPTHIFAVSVGTHVSEERCSSLRTSRSGPTCSRRSSSRPSTPGLRCLLPRLRCRRGCTSRMRCVGQQPRRTFA